MCGNSREIDDQLDARDEVARAATGLHNRRPHRRTAERAEVGTVVVDRAATGGRHRNHRVDPEYLGSPCVLEHLACVAPLNAEHERHPLPFHRVGEHLHPVDPFVTRERRHAT
jgi:hypothetical protein